MMAPLENQKIALITGISGQDGCATPPNNHNLIYTLRVISSHPFVIQELSCRAPSGERLQCSWFEQKRESRVLPSELADCNAD